jgi:proline iminopeptidase
VRLTSSCVALAAVVVVACTGREALPNAIPVSERYVTTPDSVRLWYRSVGSGPDVVIIPNALFHRERLDSLASSTRRLILYDPRGRGRSDSIVPSTASIAHNVADVETIGAAVKADSVALIGWSGMGMELFVYTLRHPTRVTRLVQLAPVAPRWIPYVDSLGRSRTARTDRAAAAQLAARERGGDFASDPAGLCRAWARVSTPASFGDTSFAHLAPDVCDSPNEWPSRIGAYFDALLGSMGSFDWRGDLPRVTIPRLVIHGERDNTPLAGNCEWVAGQPNARMLIVRGAGHWPHYERPDVTLQAIRAFLDGGWPDGTGGCA